MVSRSSPGVVELLGRLVGEARRLLDQRLALLKAELKDEAEGIARGIGLLAGAMAGILAGSALLLLALGLWVGELVGSTPGGLAIVGGALAAGGGGLGLWGVRTLRRRRRLLSETVRELRRDAEWIQNGA